MSLTAIILAAGKSTRMKSARPKVMHEVCGRAMLDHVLRACFDAGCTRILCVVGHGKEQVINAFSDDKRIHWVEQNEQLGTGHAAKMCLPQLKDTHGDVIILTGDAPMIRGEVLTRLVETHKADHAIASMATAVLDDPYGYGRIVRDAASGEFVEIVEQVDATPEQAAIKEVFPSYYCLKATELVHALGKLQNNNRKREFYLTDVFGILRREGKKITVVQAVLPEDVLGVNTREQLADVDEIMQERVQTNLRESGVTIVNSFNTYVECGAAIGVDTVIQPFTFIGRDATIGRDCVIGPFAMVPRGAVVPDGMTIGCSTAVSAVDFVTRPSRL